MSEFERDVKVEWKPIQTAPRDGRWFILWTASVNFEIALCRWTPESNRWRVKSLPGLGERLADLLDFRDTVTHRWIELEPFFNGDAWRPRDIDPSLPAGGEAEREAMRAISAGMVATGAMLDRLATERKVQRNLVALRPGEPQPVYALGVEVPEGYRLETDAEFRARFTTLPRAPE